MPSVRQKKYNEKSLFSHLSFGAHTQAIQSSSLELNNNNQNHHEVTEKLLHRVKDDKWSSILRAVTVQLNF